MFPVILSAFLLIGKLHATYLGGYDLTNTSRFTWLIAYSILCYLVAYSFGLPEVSSPSARIKSSLVSAFTSAVLIGFVQIVLGQLTIPRFVIALSIPVLFVLFMLFSLLVSSVNRTATQNERLLLICSNADKQIIMSDLAFHSEIPCLVAMHIEISEAQKIENFADIISEKRITLIVLDNDVAKDPHIISAVASAHSRGVRVRTQIAFYNNWIGKTPVRELGETALLFDVREIHLVGYSRISRLFDIGIASLGFVVFMVATPFVFIGNYLGNRGPLLYVQDRVGKGQTTFRIFKFRSMSPGGLSNEWTKADDLRITRFGKFLRLSHLDELPQVVNILRGDLSIVGPRPEQSHYVEQLSKTIPYYQSRHLVRPGLTGWAQVNYPYGADEIDAFEKLQYEFWYLQHQSMWLDLRIIARTFRHVLGFKGR
jgi:lipopolysaccharide/colanic/teichoic acid biosynthesis glycosyltransferase